VFHYETSPKKNTVCGRITLVWTKSLVQSGFLRVFLRAKDKSSTIQSNCENKDPLTTCENATWPRNCLRRIKLRRDGEMHGHGLILRRVIMQSLSHNKEVRQWQFLHRKRREMLFANSESSEATTSDYRVGYGRISLLHQSNRTSKPATARARVSQQKGEGLYLVKLRLRLSESRWSRFFGRSEYHRPTVTSASAKPN
jgi:hypothetical protein